MLSFSPRNRALSCRLRPPPPRISLRRDPLLPRPPPRISLRRDPLLPRRRRQVRRGAPVPERRWVPGPPPPWWRHRLRPLRRPHRPDPRLPLSPRFYRRRLLHTQARLLPRILLLPLRRLRRPFLRRPLPHRPFCLPFSALQALSLRGEIDPRPDLRLYPGSPGEPPQLSPQLLEPCVERVIYLDSDVIVVDDIRRLWDTHLPEPAVIAAPEYCHANFSPPERKRFPPPPPSAPARYEPSPPARPPQNLISKLNSLMSKDIYLRLKMGDLVAEISMEAVLHGDPRELFGVDVGGAETVERAGGETWVRGEHLPRHDAVEHVIFVSKSTKSLFLNE